MKKKIVIILCILVILVLFFIVIINRKLKNIEIVEEPIVYNENETNTEETNTEEIKNENEKKIESKISEQGLNTSKDIYEIASEYDGREILVVKSSLQYKVALSGMLKGNKPEYQEMDEVLKQAPTHSGIWTNEKSRKQFLDIINKICKSSYDINDEGYLIIKSNSIILNGMDKKINEMLSSGNLYVFDIDSITYIVNEATGIIEEYPFEEMDPEQGYEYFEDENKFMYIISNNNSGKVDQESVIKSILKNN